MKLKPAAVSLFSAPPTTRTAAAAQHLYQANSRRQVTHEDSVSQRSASSAPDSQAATSKFHRAALDGYVDMLCEASRRDTNLANKINGLTPTLLAAHSGQLEALRMLVGRGGDPERTTSDGSSGLHLAAARGHLNCVSFLVNFGANMWALDNDLHTAKDVAAIEQRREVLNYLDQMMAKQSALNTKSVQKLKEKAKIGAEKRLKQMRKAQLKAIKQIERDERYLARLSNNRRLLKSAHSISDIRLVCRSTNSSQPSSLASSVSGSERSSSALSTRCSSLVSTSPIGSLMAAVASRQTCGVAKPMKSSPSSRLFGPGSKCSPGHQPSANNKLGNQSSDEASTSSTHSSLSSSVSANSMAPPTITATATAKPAVRQRQPTSQAPASESKNNRPKYSELVAIRRLDETRNCPVSSCLSAAKTTTPAANQKHTASNNPTTIGSKLTRGLGGVSRKVQLRKFLQMGAACSASDLRAADPAGTGAATKAAATTTTTTTAQSCGSSAPISWPPAPALNRTVSEPDFGQVNEASRFDSDHSRGSSRRGSIKLRQAGQKQQQQQQQQSGGLQRSDESHHKLLTQCLTQLKMRHEQSSRSTAPEDGNLCSGPASRNNPVIQSNGHSDELLLHQRLSGAPNERPIKPSVIKQHLQQQRQNRTHEPTEEAPTGRSEAPVAGSADSIGSAGSLALSAFRSSSSMANSASFSSSGSFESRKTSIVEPCENFVNNLSHSLCATKQADSTMEAFLSKSGLLDLSEVFAREKIDLEALMLLTEDDLKSLNILLGPRRKLLKAIADRRLAMLNSTAQAADAGGTKYVMVDTPL